MSRAKLARRLLVAHGVAAVFHDDDLLVVALHVRQRFRQDAGLLLRVDLGRALLIARGSVECGGSAVKPVLPDNHGLWCRPPTKRPPACR